MSKLKNLLIKRTEEERDLTGKLADVLGCNRSVITKFKNPGKELDSFDSLIAIARYLDEKNELELMIDYANEIDVNNKTARYMLEYLAVNRKTEALRELLNRMKEAKNKESLEWASFYELLYTQLTDYYSVDYKQRIIDTATYRTNTVEMKVMGKLLNVYSYYEVNDYKSMLNLIPVIEGLLEEIKDTFIGRIYLSRTLEMKSYVYLTVLDQVEEARKIAHKSIELNTSKKFTAYAYYILGLSYLYESFENGMKYFNKSIELYEEVQFSTSVHEVEETKEMFAAIWSKKVDYKIDYCSKLCSIYRGEKPEIDCVNRDVAFEKLTEGMKNKDFNQLLNSLIEFIKRGDKFFANLPRIELNKLGFKHDFIDNLINIHNY